MIDAEARAAQAKTLLGDPLLNEVLDSIEAAAIAAWGTSKMDAVADREFAYQALKASRRIRETLKGVVDDGLIAASRAVRR